MLPAEGYCSSCASQVGGIKGCLLWLARNEEYRHSTTITSNITLVQLYSCSLHVVIVVVVAGLLTILLRLPYPYCCCSSCFLICGAVLVCRCTSCEKNKNKISGPLQTTYSSGSTSSTIILHKIVLEPTTTVN